MSLTSWKSEYLTVIKLHVQNTIGFDEAFAGISSEFLQMLVGLIVNPSMYKGVYIHSYNEVADFLDGNGFKVEGQEGVGYRISLLNT